MTKYVLNSGGMKRVGDNGKAFFEELLKGTSYNKILLCLFAQKRGHWEPKLEEFEVYFKELFDYKIELELAFPKTLEKQLKDHEVIYIHGGDDAMLKYWMQGYDLAKLFDNKKVGTNSASSDMLSKYYWTCDWRELQEGFGILPIKFLPHYRSEYGNEDPRGPIDWEGAYEDLRNYKDKNLPIHALEEGEFIVIEQ